MKFIIIIICYIIGAVTNNYIPSEWQYVWQYVWGFIFGATITFLLSFGG